VVRSFAVVVLLLGLAGCGGGGSDSPGQTADAGVGDVLGDGRADGLPHYVIRLEDSSDIAGLAAGDLSVKYLAALEPGTQPAPVDQSCVFQDMHDASWHLEFLSAFPAFGGLDLETYLNLVLRRRTRTLWGGAVQLWPGAEHALTGVPGVVSFSVYADEGVQDQLTVDDVIDVHARLSGCVGFAPQLVFLAQGPLQTALVRDQPEAFSAAGIVATDAATLAGAGVEVYTEGTGYGTLVVAESTSGLEVGQRDVLVLESAPNDIGIVAGLITSQPQTLHSHVNLLLGEKGIPNARIPGARQRAELLALEGTLVRIRADAQGVEVTPATVEQAQEHWNQTRPDVGQPRADLSVRGLGVYGNPDGVAADAYGVKASNVAELCLAFGPDEAPCGFGVPFSAYRAHVVQHGVDTQISAFLADPRRHADPEWRRGALDDIRDTIRDGAVDPDLLATVEVQVRAWLGPEAETTRLRFRSSTNVEDLEALTGAGLYDSRSGCLGDDLDGDDVGPSRCLSDREAAALRQLLDDSRRRLAADPEQTWLAARIEDLEGDLTKEKPIARALPRVWRSLWNDRAWMEREYYGIDHQLAYMGVAVNPSFVLEQLDAVVVTNLDGDPRGPLFRVVTQAAPESVVRPEDPSAVAEVRTVRRGADGLVDDTLWVESTAGADLWGEQFLELMDVVFRVHDHFASYVYDDLGIALDLEVKRTDQGRVVVKQIRPYVMEGP
jgi:pyruvate, water dikinase